jgi:O-antigen ligase
MNIQADPVTPFQIKFWLITAMLIGVILGLITGHFYFMALGPLLLLGIAGLDQISRIYYLVLFCIPFSWEWKVSETLGTDFPDEPLLWFLCILLIFHFILYRDRIAEKKINPWIFRLLLLHLGWIFICSLLSAHLLLSFKYFVAKCWYIIALGLGTWYCVNSRRDVFRIVILLIAAMMPVVALILYAHAQSGFTFESVNDSVQPFFRNHVNYGAFLACMIPLSVAGYILSPRYRLLFALIFICWSGALFFSYSRGAWMSALTGLITVLAIRFKVLHWLGGLSVILFIGLFTYFSIGNRYLDYRPNFEQTIYHQQFREHLEATYNLTDLSTAERFHRWIGGVRMTQDQQLHGYGPNSFYYSYKPYTVTAFQTYVSDNKEQSTVHNYFLLLWVEQGIPGVSLFLLLLLGLFYLAYKWYHGTDDKTEKVMAATIACILSMIVTLNMLSDLIETDKIGGLFFICTGILLLANVKGKVHWKEMT